MGWLTGWTYRKSHLITGSAGAVANYQTCIKVYKTTGTDGTETVRGITAGKVYVGSNCRDDFGDIRFTDNDGITELDYWMESSTSGTSAVFWVEVKDSLASDQTIYVYYGKSDEVTTSNGTNTFKVFFNGDSAGWTVTDPNTRFSFGSGKLTWTNLTRNEDAYVYKSVSALGSTFLIRFSAMTDLIDTNAIVGMMQHSDNVDDNGAFDNGWAIEDNHNQYLYLKRRKADVAAYSSACAGRSDATQYWYVMYISGNNLTLKCYSNSTFVTQVGSTITRDISDITLANLVYFFLVSSLNSGSNLRCSGYVTEVIVRQWISSEPAHSTWGGEEVLTHAKTYDIDMLSVAWGKELYDIDTTLKKEGVLKTSLIDVHFKGVNWLGNWAHRKSHVINAQVGAGTNYQVCIKVYKTTGTDGTEVMGNITAGKVYVGSDCRDDFGDIRFTSWDGETLLDYWMDPDLLVSGTSAVFWVEIADDLDVVNRTIYIYYQKPSATDASSGENTFLMFFNGNATGWTVVDPNNKFSFANGKLTYTVLGRGEKAYVCKALAVTDYRVRWKRNVASADSSHVHEEMVNARLANDMSANTYQHGYDDETKDYQYYRRRVNGVNGSSAKRVVSYGTTYWIDVRVYGATLTAYRTIYTDAARTAGALGPDSLDVSGVTNCAYFHLIQGTNDSSGSQGTGWLTNAYMTKYISPEPVHSTWGDEEAIPVCNLDVVFKKTGVTTTSSIDFIISSNYWYSDWKYRKSHNINAATGAGTNYQVMIKIYKGSGTDGTESVDNLTAGKVYCNNHCRDDFGDIRFTTNDGKTLMDYWIQEVSSGNYAIFWIEIPNNLDYFGIMIYVYYGKSDEATTSNGDNTFIFFDHFDGASIDTSKWSGDTGSVTVVSSIATLSGWAKHIRGKTPVARPCRFMSNVKISVDGIDTFFGIGDTPNVPDYPYMPLNGILYYSQSGASNKLLTSINGTFHEQASNISGMSSYHDRQIKYHVTHSYCSKDNIQEKDITTYIPTQSMVPWYESRTSIDVLIDWVFMAKYVSSEPVHSVWGIEEEHPKLTYSIDVVLLNFGGISFKLDTLLKKLNVITSTLVDIKISPAWLAGWLYRKSHIITGSAGAGTDYQVCIKVYKGSGTDGTETVNGNIVGKVYCNNLCHDDFGDIRFTDDDAMTLLKYWIQEVSSGNYAIFWIKVTEDLDFDSTIYVYYDNDIATSIADGENTFRMFDEDWTEFSAFPEYTIATANGTPRCFIARLIICPNGDILAGYNRSSDENQIHSEIYLKKSTDGGITWGAETKIIPKTGSYGAIAATFSINSAGTIFLRYIRWYSTSIDEIWQVESTDNGDTWENNRCIFDSSAHGYNDCENNGIIIQNGTYAGRLIVPISWGSGTTWTSGCLYSDDDGTTWTEGGAVPKGGYQCDEPTVVELSTDGQIYMLMRNTSGGRLLQTTSDDGGLTWSTASQSGLTNNDSPACLLRTSFSPNIILVSWDNQSGILRRPLDVALSTDDCATWINTKVIKNAGIPTAYPSIVYTNDGYIVLAYWDYTTPEDVKNTRFELSLLTNPIWQGNTNSVTLSSGIATLSGSNQHIDGTIKHSPPFRLMHKVKISSDSVEGAILGTGDAGNDYSYIPENGEFYYSMSTGNGNHRIYVRNSDSNTSKATNISGLSGYHIREITHTSTHVIFKNDGSQEVDITSNIPTQDVSIWYESKTNCNVLIDWAFLAKYISPEPAHDTWGIEESVVRTIIDSIDVLLKKFGALKTDSIDVLFKSLGISKTDSIDVLFQKLGITITDVIDVLLTKRFKPTSSIDVMFKKLRITETDSIDILFKKLGLNQTYDTDVLLSNAKQLSCFLDVMLMSAKIIGIGGGHPVEMDRRIAKGIVKYIERNFNFKVIALKVVSVRHQQKIPAEELQIAQKVESNKSVSELKIVEKSSHSNRMAELDIVKPYSQYISLNKLAIARECPQSVSLIELAVVKEQLYSIALMELQLSKEQIAGFGIDSLNILSERGMIFASAGLDIVSKNTLSISVESLSTRKKKMTKRELIDLLDKLDELDE